MDMKHTYHDPFETHDLADFAQEFLRRNARYRAQYAALGDEAHLEPAASRCTRMAQGWGLEFPFRT